MKTTLNQSRLIKISDILCDNIDLVLDKLNIRLWNGSVSYCGRCPIHLGDNSQALNLYPEGHTHRGYWKCITRQCQNTFKPTIIGFIRGVLSSQNHGWRKAGDPFESFDSTLQFISDILKINLNTIECDHEELEKKRFLARTSWNVPMIKNKPLITREKVKQRIGNPPRYFLNRGFSEDILIKYDVGYCNDPEKEMYQRCIVPVYNESGDYLVGCLGRSIYEKCHKCNKFHNPYDIKCPKYEIPKWKTSKHFSKKDILYNYWFSKDHIKMSKTAVLVESCGNVWRLSESGIHNSVGLFGCELSDGQEFLLEKIGVMNLIVIMDGDDAGRIAANRIIEKTKNFYNVKPIYIDSGDIADLSIDQIRQDIMPNL